MLNINQTTKDIKSLTALHRRSFVALIRNKGSLILTVKTTLFYFTFDYSISIVIVITILTKIIVIMIFVIIEQPY